MNWWILAASGLSDDASSSLAYALTGVVSLYMPSEFSHDDFVRPDAGFVFDRWQCEYHVTFRTLLH